MSWQTARLRLRCFRFRKSKNRLHLNGRRSFLTLRARLEESSDAVAVAEESLRLAELADSARGRRSSYAYRGHARALLGKVPVALADFREALDWQHKDDRDDDPLYSQRGIHHTHLLTRLGRHEEAQRLTEANIGMERQIAGPDNFYEPQCRLILASRQLSSGDVSEAERLCHEARDWALARDAKEVLCWSALVHARSSPPLPWREEGP